MLRAMKAITILTMLALISPVPADEGNPQIDYKGFAELVQKIEPVRYSKRVNEEEFLKMASESNTVILDTRSKAKFDKFHVKGALHLNFSDFNEEALSELIPDKKTRILIYCNNNFEDAITAMPMKRPPLALNIPTYINLQGYGYEQVYELEGYKSVKVSKIPFAGTDVERTAK